MDKKKYRVFLGGTCNESQWRNVLIRLLKIDYYNPVVPDWTPECMKEEKIQRKKCDFCLYVITPKMTGVYAIAEAVEDSIKRPEKTVFCFLLADEDDRFTDGQLRSLAQVGKMVQGNGAVYLSGINEVADYLNEK